QGGTNGGNPDKMQVIADEERQRKVGPIIEAVERRKDDLEGRDGPGRNEIGRQQRAVECAAPPVSGHVDSRLVPRPRSEACGLWGDVTPPNCQRQFKPFVYLNAWR